MRSECFKSLLMLYINSVATIHTWLFKHKLLIKIQQDLHFSSSNSHVAAGHYTGQHKERTLPWVQGCSPRQRYSGTSVCSCLPRLHSSAIAPSRQFCQLCDDSWLPHSHSSCSWLFHFYAFLCYQHFPFPFLSLCSIHIVPVNFTDLF